MRRERAAVRGPGTMVLHHMWTRGMQDLSCQLTASLFPSCKGKSIAAALFWYNNHVDLFP